MFSGSPFKSKNCTCNDSTPSAFNKPHVNSANIYPCSLKTATPAKLSGLDPITSLSSSISPIVSNLRESKYFQMNYSVSCECFPVIKMSSAVLK